MPFFGLNQSANPNCHERRLSPVQEPMPWQAKPWAPANTGPREFAQDAQEAAARAQSGSQALECGTLQWVQQAGGGKPHMQRVYMGENDPNPLCRPQTTNNTILFVRCIDWNFCVAIWP